MLLKFTLNDRQLILNNPEALVRANQINFIQCYIDLKSRVFNANSTLVAVFKSASYNVKEEVLLDIRYDVKDDNIVHLSCFTFVPNKVFEHGGVIQLLIYKYKEKAGNYHYAQDSTNTIEFYVDPTKYVPLRTSAIWQQLANEIEELRMGGLQNISYDDLIDRPAIEGVTLTGDKTFPQLNLKSLTNSEIEALLSNSGGI